MRYEEADGELREHGSFHETTQLLRDRRVYARFAGNGQPRRSSPNRKLAGSALCGSGSAVWNHR